MKLLSSKTIFTTAHQKLHLKASPHLVTEELYKIPVSFIEQYAILFEHFVNLFDPFLLIRLKYVSEEERLFISRFDHVIYHQIAFVKKGQELSSERLYLLLNQCIESLNVLFQLLETV